MENKIITIRNVYGKVKEVHFQPCRQENGTPWPFVKPVRYDSNGNSELILSDKERNDPNNKYFIPEDMDIVVKDGTTFDEIYSLFVFDRMFRNIIFKNILIVENNYKSILNNIF